MRKILFLSVLLVSGFMTGQIVNIPDANFKAALLASGFDTNTDGEIQVTEAAVVTEIDINGDLISDLTGLEAFVLLERFTAPNLEVAAIAISDMPNLERLEVEYGEFTSIVLVNLPSFNELKSSYCPNLTTIDLSALGSGFMQQLESSGGVLSALDVDHIVGFDYFDVSYNALSVLDFNLCGPVYATNLTANPIMQLFVKNGLDQVILVDDSATPIYICTDDSEISMYQAAYNTYATQVNINSYCSPNPGGAYNAIMGTVRLDQDLNGCDASGAPMYLTRMRMDDGSTASDVFTDASGTYQLYPGTGDFTVVPQLENPTYFTVNPVSASVNFPALDSSVSVQDFCLSANGVAPDVEVTVSPWGAPVIGNEVVYQVTLRNKGNQTVSQPLGVSCSYNYEQMYIVSTSPAYEMTDGYSVFWSYQDLQPFETRTYFCTMEIHNPGDVYPVNIGDLLQVSAQVSLPGDLDDSDNDFMLEQQAVGSFDPNDILCLEGDDEPTNSIGEYLHYRIRFENTGNAPAENIVLRMAIDPAKFNVNSLQMLQSSHPADIRIKNNILEIIMQSANLDSGGHGNVLLKVRSDAGLQQGDSVTQQADIYFDYNFPVATNAAETVFGDLSSGDVKTIEVSVYPNPTSGQFHIRSAEILTGFDLFDVQGRLLLTRQESGNELDIDLSSYQGQLFFVRAKTPKGHKTLKIVKTE